MPRENRIVNVSFNCTPSEKELLGMLCAVRNVSQSDLIRDLIQEEGYRLSDLEEYDEGQRKQYGE